MYSHEPACAPAPEPVCVCVHVRVSKREGPAWKLRCFTLWPWDPCVPEALSACVPGGGGAVSGQAPPPVTSWAPAPSHLPSHQPPWQPPCLQTLCLPLRALLGRQPSARLQLELDLVSLSPGPSTRPAPLLCPRGIMGRGGGDNTGRVSDPKGPLNPGSIPRTGDTGPCPGQPR